MSNINYVSKNWKDTPLQGTSITAEDMNRIDNAVSTLSSSLNVVKEGTYDFLTLYRIGNLVIGTVTYTITGTCEAWSTVAQVTLPDRLAPLSIFRYPLHVDVKGEVPFLLVVSNSGNASIMYRNNVEHTFDGVGNNVWGTFVYVVN